MGYSPTKRTYQKSNRPITSGFHFLEALLEPKPLGGMVESQERCADWMVVSAERIKVDIPQEVQEDFGAELMSR